jgi:hypothetical protein
MVPLWDYASEQDFELNCPFRRISSPFELRTLDKTSLLGKIVGSLPQNLSGSPLV